MSLYDFLVTSYFNVLAIFPQPLAWITSVLILVGLVFAFISLIRVNLLFVIVLILLLPALIPILGHILAELWAFFVFVYHQAAAGAH